MSDQPQSPPQPQAPSHAAQAATFFRAAGERAAPLLRRWAEWIADWLVRVGWGKFFLVAILMMIFGAIFGSVFFDRQAAVVIERVPQDVKVEVSVGPDGVRVQAPRKKGTAPAAPAAPAEPAAPADAAVPAEPPAAPAEAARPGEAQVKIDEQGVRIVSDKGGKQVSIVVDSRGVRVEEIKAPGAAEPAAGGVLIPLPPGAGEDPAKVAAAVEAARAEVESIVEDQIDRSAARTARHVSAESSDWFMSFIFLLIVTGIIVKVVLGGKKKAETRAEAASMTAAEEGLKRQLAEAQLKMMQAQVEPHFLFNTLASVDYLIETDPARASQMQKNLIAYLRASLPQMREGSTTLGKEVAQCRAYLEILKVRMEDRLQPAIMVPQGLLTAQFPPMMLQSLVENAIKHGLEPKPEGGALSISADVINGMLRVTVADTGLGFAAESASGVGLSNIRERLVQLYGGRAQFVVAANSPGGTIATIEVPYSWEAGNAPSAA